MKHVDFITCVSAYILLCNWHLLFQTLFLHIQIAVSVSALIAQQGRTDLLIFTQPDRQPIPIKTFLCLRNQGQLSTKAIRRQYLEWRFASA